jgi:hypothetical protein
MVPERRDERHPFLVIELSLVAAALVPILIVSAYLFAFISGKAALVSRSDRMKRRCMGLWCPHLPTAADMGHGIKLWATSLESNDRKRSSLIPVGKSRSLTLSRFERVAAWMK